MCALKALVIANQTSYLVGKNNVLLGARIARRPKLLLLDEPLAALDKKLREDTQFELVNIQEDLGNDVCGCHT